MKRIAALLLLPFFVALFASAAELPPLTNFDSGKILQSADLKALVQAVASLQDQVNGMQSGGVATGMSNLKHGHKSYTTPGTYTFTWPAGVAEVFVEVHGSGAAGGGSKWKLYGGGGGSGAYCSAVIPRPASGITQVVVDQGMAGVPANTLNSANLQTGQTSFGDARAYGAGIGQPATNASVGGDGGTPGVCSVDGLYLVEYIPGGQGGASAPGAVPADSNQGASISAHFPYGADAPKGGMGGNNNQSGQAPGGGGAPGDSEFGSGSGGAGSVIVQWFQP
ncbi:MAG: hypothetical protein RLZZ416_43 [Candidatus Parcubacteria bacterium]|jgi:hypothetical protein